MGERWMMGSALLLMIGMAHAGDIYVCKGANGVNVYQNTPCPTKQPQVKHSTYDESLSRAPVGQGAGAQVVEQRVVYEQPPAGSLAGAANPQQAIPLTTPTAYQCTAGRRTWIQKAPCPSSYNQAAPVTVSGFTAGGQHFTGNGWVDQRAPVGQQQLDQSTLCDRVRAGANVGGNSEASRSYERNKIKRNLCGG